MRDAGVRHVPIHAGQRLVGLVSIRDVLSVLLLGSSENDVLSQRSPLLGRRHRRTGTASTMPIGVRHAAPRRRSAVRGISHRPGVLFHGEDTSR
jgi:hypothetical protein